MSIFGYKKNNPSVQAVIDKIEAEKIVAIVRGIAKEDLIPLVEAMYEGGIRLVEVTYGKMSDEETAECIKMLSDTFADKMYVGAGTVLTKKQVVLTKQAGGQFIISPDANKSVIRKTKKMQMVSIPGVLTPSEITMAVKNGADFVKLFPVTSMGPEYVKAIKAPLSGIKMLAVGGVDETNMDDYLKVGISGFGIGSNIVNKKMIEAKDFAGITKLSEKFVEVVK